MSDKLIKLYQVGGAVRDGLMGVPSKDIDYAVEAPNFDWMYEALKMLGVEIFEGAAKPEFFTIRGKWNGVASDFVLCRKDGHYKDGRHPEGVTVGTIYDDLARRDFTVNAMALDQDKNLIDPFKGQVDLKGKVLRCVGKPEDRFTEDGLRILRAVRFSITKGFALDYLITNLLCQPAFFSTKLDSVSTERVREELFKCFSFSTLDTLNFFDRFRTFRNFLFKHKDGLWLRPTQEAR